MNNHEKALGRAYALGLEVGERYATDDLLSEVPSNTLLRLGLNSWETDILYHCLDIYAPALKVRIASSRLSPDAILPRSAEWKGRYEQGLAESINTTKSRDHD